MRYIWLTLAAFCACLSLLVATPSAQAQGAPVITPEDHVLGNADAPVTIMEYASLTCPHCAEFERETLPKIKEAWIDTGKVKLVYRDYPLDGTSLHAAMVAQCAPADRYFAFIETLFRNQNSWVRNDAEQAVSRIAKLAGISDEQFKKCWNDEALGNAIVASRKTAAESYGVQSTPTFFINGTRLVGAQPYEQFEKLITAASPQ
jgi:protein-disulfide isomerase